MLQSRAMASTRVEDSYTSAEGRASRRFPRSTSDGELSLPRPDPVPLTKGMIEPQPSSQNRRRQSTRDQKPPQGLGSIQSSPSKRLSNSFVSQRPFAPNSSKDSHSRQTSINETSRFSFGSFGPTSKLEGASESGSFEFLPVVQFDDFHNSLGSEETDLSSFPAPGGGGYKAPRKPHTNGVVEHKIGLRNTAKKIDQLNPESFTSSNNSLLRQQDSSAGQASKSAESVAVMGPPVAPLAGKARRKSHFPAPTATVETVSRPPRKSVGPGTLPLDISQQVPQSRRPSAGQTNSSSIGSFTNPPERTYIRESSRNQTGDSLDGGRKLETPRDKKIKSLQPPSRLTQDYLSGLSGRPNHTPPLTISTARSPARSTGQRTNTPSSAKRLSIMPGSAHATGLGARTISPTDARRMKRMSIVPNPPPIPYTPPTPQPETQSLGTRSSTHSPSLVLRKSVTPSSSRTTPEANRKSYSSGISNSSSTSYSSFLASMGPSRISQSFSTSRLPTPKTRSDIVSGGGEEEVPPVPAIPKAYESPKAEFDQPFFSARKSSLPFDTSSLNSISTTDGALSQSIEVDLAKPDRETRQRRGPAIEEGTGNDRKVSGGTANSRRNLQPLRLPPLNLLPLSTPTAAKITALYEGTGATNLGNLTPPPKIGVTKTPSTPMTASKASFFSRGVHEEDPAPSSFQRPTSSSTHLVRPDAYSYRTPSSSSSVAPPVRDQYASRASRKAMSPFVSSSLPKSSGDFGYLRKAGEEPITTNGGAEIKPSRLTGPRSQKLTKVSRDDNSSNQENESPIERSTPSIGSSLRRKLSLTRKRSVSKTQSIVEPDLDLPPKPPKHDQMPPPRLPASATWNGPLLPTPSPTQKVNRLNNSRKPSNPNITIHHDRNRSNTWSVEDSPKREPAHPEPNSNSTSTRTPRAVLESSSTSNSLSLKDFLREVKTMDLQLDHDDLSAEEEMKKLALKRKDTESAAKEIDALRRRATAKERVSPNQAIRMAHLNIFERGEIVDYKDVYFCGTHDAKKHVGDLTAETANFGYDDERGDYNIVTGDHLLYRYEIVDILGKGSFGQVVRCVDHKTGGLVAIKIIRNKKRFHQQALVEVDILKKLRDWDPHNKHSMVSFTQSFYFRGHLCISTELLGMNLYEFIKSHDFRGFSLKLIRRFAKQLLSSLILLKSHKVIHCDLKPENVLLAHPAHSEIKVIDFGSSCLENEKVYTYIQSRFYRSPEVILGMTYGIPIDMWSLGCILAELLTGYPIFPGENEQEQLACIMEVFGPPEKHLIEKSTRKKLFFDSLGKPRLTVSSKGKRRRPSSKTLQQALKCEDEAFLDFITRCLRWDPDRRLKPDEATRHEFITGTKSSARPLRPHLSTAMSSPVKRYNSMQTPAGMRPLPEPPVTSFKNGTAVKSRDVPSNSPSKPAAAPKRHSTINGLQSSAGVKRSLNGNAIAGSALPRVTSRTVSGKSDMAMAAATASLQSSR